MSAPRAYLITTDHAGQVRLSRIGHWGNIPHPSDEAAEAAARADAGNKPVSVRRLVLAPLPAFRTHHTS